MPRNRVQFLLLTLVLFNAPTLSADAASVARQWREQNEQAIIDGFVDLLGIPNVAVDAENIRRNSEQISNNSAWQ